MKRFFLLGLISVVLFNFAKAQTTDKPMSFQGYAIDVNGKPLANTDITVRFTIYSPSVSDQFQEEQNLSTDMYGVFTALIGTVNQADYRKLDFTQHQDYKLKVEVRETSGGTYNTVYDSDLPSVAFARYAFNGVPVGTVVPFAGPESMIPDGWLKCDGSLLNTADYPQLFNVIGYSWGGSNGQFRLPDLRGAFLRGVDDGSGKDPDADSRYALNGGNTGNTVGSYQDGEIQSHNHYVDLTTSTNGAHSHYAYIDQGSGGIPGDPYVDTWTDGDDASKNSTDVLPNGHLPTNTAGDHSHTVQGNTNNTGGSETRPYNAYVYYIIKY